VGTKVSVAGRGIEVNYTNRSGFYTNPQIDGNQCPISGKRGKSGALTGFV
jgi:hypothetical protein